MLRRIDNRIQILKKEKAELLRLIHPSDGAEGDLKGSFSFAESGERLPDKFAPSLKSGNLKELRVAAIMDRFTLECFSPECILTELTPGNWRQEMEEAQPELLFVESAWDGKEQLWHNKINRCAPEFTALADYCHERKIPVVFWNKEDPIYTDTFMAAARHADAVFTTDLDCVQKYKLELGHNNVFHLHFAAQPRIHNPIEKYERKDRFCFAGAYYHRYADRCRVFDAFAEHFINTRGLDIYDRNYQSARSEHRFPACYDPYILGKLDPSEIDIAYKGYTFGINMNSVSQSQTMFARRVFELMASNTVVVGNYSRGVKNYFGDLTVCTDDEKTLKAALERYCKDKSTTEKLRLQALRAVLREHLCEDRLDEIAETVFGRSLKQQLPSICIYSRVRDAAEAERVISAWKRQSYPNCTLVLIGDGLAAPTESGVSLLSPEAFAAQAGPENCPAEYAAYFHPSDWYGENYLLDLALTLRYGSFAVIGKAEYLCAEEGEPRRKGEGSAYRPAETLMLRRAIARKERINAESWPSLDGDLLLEGEGLFSADALNYCEAWTDSRCPVAEDMDIPDRGIPLDEMRDAAARISPPVQLGLTHTIKAAEIAATKVKNDRLKLSLQGLNAVLTSKLEPGVHEYIYLSETLEVSPFLQNGKLPVLFLGEGDLDLICGFVFYDAQGKKLEPKYPKLGRRELLEPPAGAVRLRPLLRPKGSGTAELQGIRLGVQETELWGGCFLSHSNVLVLTNHYPAPEDLYRNMFVHRRVSSYRERGICLDVMRMNPFVKDQVRDFEGVPVIEGLGDTLASILSWGKVDTVCVHFLDWDMWSVLKNYLDSVRLIIWSHGADIQPWWRREFNYHSEDERTCAKAESEKRMALWNEVFDAASERSGRITLVFVSEYARRIVEEDYHRKLDAVSEIIPNCIDTGLFRYEKKAEEDRLRVISIRPYTSDIYANDITVKAICALAKRPFFEEMRFTLIGRGPMFEKTVQPLRRFPNVLLREEFLRQDEIAELYHENGIVLIPTRGDTQGVSRDEAMACGLVPVTNAVAAIPEFVDDSCGILTPAEDVQAIADGLERLYREPDLFLRLSEGAAKRVRRQSSGEYTIERELALILPGYAPAGKPTEPERDAAPAGESTPCRISIFGSCTSRDLFRLHPEAPFELKSYIARQSVLSAISPPVPLDMEVIQLDSAFQRRCVWQDFHKTTFDMLKNDGSEWLLIDLIDERFPLAKLQGSYVTKSGLAVDGGVIGTAETLVRRRKGPDYYMDGICIRDGVKSFCRKLKDIYPSDHIVIHKALMVEQYKSAEGLLQPFSEHEIEVARQVNEMLRYMYGLLEEFLPEAQVIDCIENYVGSELHTWGRATVHYEDEYYAEVIRRLGIITQKGRSPS